MRRIPADRKPCRLPPVPMSSWCVWVKIPIARHRETSTTLRFPKTSDRSSRLSRAQAKPILMVLSEGRPRIVSDIEPLAKAVVDIILPGNYGGRRSGQPAQRREELQRAHSIRGPRFLLLTNYDYKPSEQVGHHGRSL